MANFMNLYFGPLNLKPEYCLYFYYVSVVFFILFALSFLGLLMYVGKNFKSIKAGYLVNSLSLLLSTFISYFANRVLYTMCVSSMK
jgi:hypothetical protein